MVKRNEHTYNDGRIYRLARGLSAPRQLVENAASSHAVVDLVQTNPSAGVFIRKIRREMRIRFYRPRSVKTYISALMQFLRWLQAPPAAVNQELVREYLEFLVDGGASPSWVSGNLAMLRTVFDKMCGLAATTGLMTPRRPHALPAVMTREEILRLLGAAPAHRDKLLLGLMYATGMRVGEVCRLRWRDFDFESCCIRVFRGKGARDRRALMPRSWRRWLRGLAQSSRPERFAFASPTDEGRHLSPRTAQRIFRRAALLAGMRGNVTCHSLRHAFATHLPEAGTDIRVIQDFLGHAHLETTRIYTHLSTRRHDPTSPLDSLQSSQRVATERPHGTPEAVRESPARLRVRLDAPRADGPHEAHVLLIAGNITVRLDGITATEERPGWLRIDLPPEERWVSQRALLPPEVASRTVTPEF